MIKIKLQPTFTTKKVISNLRDASRNIRHNKRVALDESLDYAVDRAKHWYIAGNERSRFAKSIPETRDRLHSRTGRLRATIGHSRAGWYGDRLIAKFGSGISGFPSVPYAAVHEFGFFGAQRVREHIRMQAHAWGYFGPPFPFPVHVNAYMRLMSIKARPYLFPAIADMEDDGVLQKNMDVAIEAGVDGVRL